MSSAAVPRERVSGAGTTTNCRRHGLPSRTWLSSCTTRAADGSPSAHRPPIDINTTRAESGSAGFLGMMRTPSPKRASIWAPWWATGCCVGRASPTVVTRVIQVIQVIQVIPVIRDTPGMLLSRQGSQMSTFTRW